MDPPHALVAVRDAARARLYEILAPRWRLTFAASILDLLRHMHESRFQLVLIGAHFDESRGIQAVQHAARAPHTAPIVGIITRRFPDPLRHASYEAFHFACLAMGARETLDLTLWPDDAAGNARVAELFDRLVVLPER